MKRSLSKFLSKFFKGLSVGSRSVESTLLGLSLHLCDFLVTRRKSPYFSHLTSYSLLSARRRRAGMLCGKIFLSVTINTIKMAARIGILISGRGSNMVARSEEHTSELQSLAYLVCRLLLEKKKHQT